MLDGPNGWKEAEDESLVIGPQLRIDLCESGRHHRHVGGLWEGGRRCPGVEKSASEEVEDDREGRNEEDGWEGAWKECGLVERSGKETKIEVWRGLTDRINVKT